MSSFWISDISRIERLSTDKVTFIKKVIKVIDVICDFLLVSHALMKLERSAGGFRGCRLVFKIATV